jgi:Domain of unknown function (DUF1877)
MACRGVFFAITTAQGDSLYEASGDDEALMALIEAIEETWDESNLAECDKAWDAMHRVLTDGQLEFGNGTYPLSHCVLGPRQLHEGDNYIVSLVTPEEVRDVSVSLREITQQWFEERYRAVVPKDYTPEYGEEDLRYTWTWFQGVRDLYAKAALEEKAMLFTVDQ